VRKTLQSIYENMGKPKEEEVLEESGTFSKFDLLDYTELIDEMALSNLQKIGKWDNTKNRHGYDKASVGILSSPAGLKKLEDKFNNIGGWDFNLYFVKDTNAWKNFEVGEVSTIDLERRLGLKVGIDFPTPNENDITVIFTNNAAAERIPLTPWTIAHRIGHSFAATSRRSGRDDSIEYHNMMINNHLKYILKSYGVNLEDERMIYKSNPFVRNLLESIGKFRSARMKKLLRTNEFIHECFAQFLLSDGELEFNDVPKFLLSSNRKAWGRETGRSYRLQDEIMAEEYLQSLKDELMQLFHYYLGKHIGTISIM
jgi:hypothetical protein